MVRPFAMYALGDQVMVPPVETFAANLMFGKVVSTHRRLRDSGSDSSKGPENCSLVHAVDAPAYPSKIEPIEKLRPIAVPQVLRAIGSDSPVVAQPLVIVLVWALSSYDRVRRTVGVDARQHEDLELVEHRLGGGVGRVVVDQAVDRLVADQRGHPLPAALLAVEEHAHLGAGPVGADPVDPLLERPAGH